MADGIGPTLREARNRRNISLLEAEAALKIRVRYLRAIENEEWSELPGGAYTRSFLRTYASFLGLDGERLADLYDAPASPAAVDERSPRVEPAPPIASRRARRGRRWAPLAVAAAALAAAALVVIAIGGGGGGGGGGAQDSASPHVASHSGQAEKKRAAGVAVSLAATAEVWVCLLDAAGRPLVDGQVLSAGAQEGPFHSDSFKVSFGNGEVKMRVNGKDAPIPESASPLGYVVSAGGGLSSLSEGERPTCT